MPTNRPVATVASTATTAAAQNPYPESVVRMARVYAPTPKNATWARLICPEMPMARPIPMANRA